MGSLNPTIKIEPETKAALDKLKLIDEEPYDSVIQRLIKQTKALGVKVVQ